MPSGSWVKASRVCTQGYSQSSHELSLPPPCLEVLSHVQQVDLIVASLARDSFERGCTGRPACAQREKEIEGSKGEG